MGSGADFIRKQAEEAARKVTLFGRLVVDQNMDQLTDIADVDTDAGTATLPNGQKKNLLFRNSPNKIDGVTKVNSDTVYCPSQVQSNFIVQDGSTPWVLIQPYPFNPPSTFALKIMDAARDITADVPLPPAFAALGLHNNSANDTIGVGSLFFNFAASGKHFAVWCFQYSGTQPYYNTTSAVAKWVIFENFSIARDSQGNGVFVSDAPITGTVDLTSALPAPPDPAVPPIPGGTGLTAYNSPDTYDIFVADTGIFPESGQVLTFLVQPDPTGPQGLYNVDPSVNPFGFGGLDTAISGVVYDELDPITSAKRCGLNFVGSIAVAKQAQTVVHVTRVNLNGSNHQEFATFTYNYPHGNALNAGVLNAFKLKVYTCTLSQSNPNTLLGNAGYPVLSEQDTNFPGITTHRVPIDILSPIHQGIPRVVNGNLYFQDADGNFVPGSITALNWAVDDTNPVTGQDIFGYLGLEFPDLGLITDWPTYSWTSSSISNSQFITAGFSGQYVVGTNHRYLINWNYLNSWFYYDARSSDHQIFSGPGEGYNWFTPAVFDNAGIPTHKSTAVLNQGPGIIYRGVAFRSSSTAGLAHSQLYGQVTWAPSILASNPTALASYYKDYTFVPYLQNGNPLNGTDITQLEINNSGNVILTDQVTYGYLNDPNFNGSAIIETIDTNIVEKFIEIPNARWQFTKWKYNAGTWTKVSTVTLKKPSSYSTPLGSPYGPFILR